MNDDWPSTPRLIGAAFAAVAAAGGWPAAWLALETPIHGTPVNLALIAVVLVFGTVAAALHLAIAIPAYLILRRRMTIRWWHAGIAGFVIGAVPLSLMVLKPGYQTAIRGQTVLVADGAYTAAGWLSWLQSMVPLGLCGMAGGLAFWLVVRRPDGSA